MRPLLLGLHVRFRAVPFVRVSACLLPSGKIKHEGPRYFAEITSMDDNYKTPLITAAIEMAARNIDLPGGAIFHSDRGSNYTSGEFAAALEGLGIRQSVGRTGICYDNSLAESFNATLKAERVYRTAYPTRKKAKEDIARYIELRYNRRRLHSALGYRTPQEVLDEYLNRQLAA